MRLCIMLLTYKRTSYALKTLDSVLAYLKADAEISVHIADDGSPPSHVQQLVALARQHKIADLTLTNSKRGGYGANYNLATQVVHARADIVLPLEDDWQMLRPFDVTPFVDTVARWEFSSSAQAIGCVRMGYLGWTQELRGQMVQQAGHSYLLLDPDSPEPHVFAGHPRIESVHWSRNVGAWQEGLLPGDTEFEVAHRGTARLGVAWPMCVDPRQGYGLFAHVGAIREWD